MNADPDLHPWVLIFNGSISRESSTLWLKMAVAYDGCQEEGHPSLWLLQLPTAPLLAKNRPAQAVLARAVLRSSPLALCDRRKQLS